MKINMPSNVSFIIGQLEERGFEAYAVGGCVRDTLLKRQPQDWDITTSARPMEIKSIFKRTIDTGIQHGTVTVMVNHVGYEVTTYRLDGEYVDGRHPKQVSYTSSLKMDLERRDFTINAMAYNDTSGLVDCFDGIGDLRSGIIRCVGDARQRFEEDALRMLRAVRFSGQLGFAIESGTRDAILEHVSRLQKISAERIRAELVKLLTSKDSGQFLVAWETGMTAQFLPEFDRMMELEQHNPHHIYSVGEHCIRSVEVMNYLMGRKLRTRDFEAFQQLDLKRVKDYVCSLDTKMQMVLCVTMLLHDCAKPLVMKIDEQGIGHFHGHPQKGEQLAGKILRRLTFDNETINQVKKLILYHDYRIEPNARAVRRAASKIGRGNMCLLFAVQYADVLAQNPDTYEQKLERIRLVWDMFEEAEEQKVPLSVRDLAVDGTDLMAIGIAPGPELGAVLNELLEHVLQEPEQNQKDLLLELARERGSAQSQSKGGSEDGFKC